MEALIPDFNPYHYCYNNPLNFIDHNGFYGDSAINHREDYIWNGDYIWNKELMGWEHMDVTVTAERIDPNPGANSLGSGSNNPLTTTGIIVSTTEGSNGVVGGVLKLDKDIKNLAPGLTRTVEKIGRITGILNLIIDIGKMYNSPSWSNATSLGIDAGLIMIKDNPWVAAGVTIIEASGLKDKILNYIYNEKEKK